MKMALILLFISFFAASLSYAEPFEIKNVWRGVDRLTAKEKSSGQDLWQSQIEIEETKYEGNPAFRIFEEGAGICGREKEYISWHYESYFLLDKSKLLPMQIKIAFKNKMGEIYKSIDKIFDYKSKKVICKVNGKDKEFELKDDLVDKENLGLYLSNYPFGEKKDVNFHLLTHEPSLQKMIVKYKGNFKKW